MGTVTPAEAFAPGELIREELEARGWTQADLAEILSRPLQLVNELVAGKRRVTPETAQGLSAAFATSAQFWLNMEAAYQLSQLTDSNDDAARRARLWSKVPVRDIVRRNWIAHSDNVEVLERRVLDFFEMNNLDEEIVFRDYAARKSTSYATTTPAQTAWLYRAKKLAQAVFVDSFSGAKLNQTIEELRSLLHDAKEIRHVPRILAEAGIRLVIVEPLPQSRIDGGCFWLDDRSPVIALGMRFDRIDYFWYTLMHEIAHVKNRDDLSSAVSLDVDIEAGADKPEHELAADSFATEMLVPPAELADFVARMHPIYPKSKIKEFAYRLKVDPGLVVGQLQHQGYMSYSNNREMLTKVRHAITESTSTDGWGSIVPSTI